jgi:hypothetical protein
LRSRPRVQKKTQRFTRSSGPDRVKRSRPASHFRKNGHERPAAPLPKHFSDKQEKGRPDELELVGEGQFAEQAECRERYTRTGEHKGPAFFAYSDNYLIEVKAGSSLMLKHLAPFAGPRRAWQRRRSSGPKGASASSQSVLSEMPRYGSDAELASRGQEHRGHISRCSTSRSGMTAPSRAAISAIIRPPTSTTVMTQPFSQSPS